MSCSSCASVGDKLTVISKYENSVYALFDTFYFLEKHIAVSVNQRVIKLSSAIRFNFNQATISDEINVIKSTINNIALILGNKE